jgi:hypothetical protein
MSQFRFAMLMTSCGRCEIPEQSLKVTVSEFGGAGEPPKTQSGKSNADSTEQQAQDYAEYKDDFYSIR